MTSPAQSTQPGATARSEGSFWKQYSPHGEFPLSTVASLTVHLFVVVMLVFGLIPKLTRDAEPVKVDVVHVAGTSDIPVGMEPATAEETLESQSPVVKNPGESLAQSPREEIQGIQGDPTSTGQAERIRQAQEQSIQAVREEGRKASELADRMRREFEAAKARLKENIESATTPGSAGAQAGAKRAERLARWVLTLSGKSLDQRMAVLDRLGAEVAFPLGSQKWRFFADLTGSIRSHEATLANETRLFWGPSDDTLKDVHELGRQLKVPDNSNMLLFLPPKVEQELAVKERAFANRDEADIASTVFAAQVTGSGYKVEVIKQVAKDNRK
ncbi:MAG: hypothetical protein HY000_00905 [Planctomycetes bacterium]|nr:hypothetical protein [Planctomycetota bacterium]